MEYFGVIQMDEGVDHVFLYTEDQIKKEFKNYGIDVNLLPKEKHKTVEKTLAWPYAGERSLATRIEKIGTINEAEDFLLQEAKLPDINNVTLKELADYNWVIETEEGCALDILKDSALPKDMWEKEAMKEIARIIENICEGLYIFEPDFYEDEYKDILVKEAKMIGDLRLYLQELKELPEFKMNGDALEAEYELPQEIASQVIALANLSNQEKNDKDHDLYLHVIFPYPDRFNLGMGWAVPAKYYFLEKNNGWERKIHIDFNSKSGQTEYATAVSNKLGWVIRKIRKKGFDNLKDELEQEAKTERD